MPETTTTEARPTTERSDPIAVGLCETPDCRNTGTRLSVDVSRPRGSASQHLRRTDMPSCLNVAVAGFPDERRGHRVDDLKPGLMPVVRVPGEVLAKAAPPYHRVGSSSTSTDCLDEGRPKGERGLADRRRASSRLSS